jgi:hypothetical protein
MQNNFSDDRHELLPAMTCHLGVHVIYQATQENLLVPQAGIFNSGPGACGLLSIFTGIYVGSRLWLTQFGQALAQFCLAFLQFSQPDQERPTRAL